MLQQHHYKGEQLEPNLSAIDHLKAIVTSTNAANKLNGHANLATTTTSSTGGIGGFTTEGLALGVYEPGTRQEETCLRSYLANFGLINHRATIPVKHLSGGQRMRVAMAVALVSFGIRMYIFISMRCAVLIDIIFIFDYYYSFLLNTLLFYFFLCHVTQQILYHFYIRIIINGMLLYVD